MKFTIQIALGVLLASVFNAKVNAQVPLCNWITASTGTNSGNLQLDYGNGGMKTDSAGNVYFVGTFSHGTFQIGSLSVNDTDNTNWFYIGKINSAGHPVWLKAISATGTAAVRSIAVNVSGHFVISGDYIGNIVFDATHQLTNSGSLKFFIAGYDSSGTLGWFGTPGGATIGINQLFGLYLDDNNNTYCTGYFTSTLEYDTTLTTTYTALFAAKLDAGGTRQWIRSGDVLDNYSLTSGLNIAAQGNAVYVTGYLGDSSSFATTPVTKLISAGVHDVFLAKYTTGGHLQWAKDIGGNSQGNVVYGLSIDGQLNSYLDGSFEGATAIFGADTTYGHLGILSGFLTKCDSSGNVLWVDYGSCSGSAVFTDLATDEAGNSIVSGSFSLLNMIVGNGKTQLTSVTNKGLSDGFLLGFDTNDNLMWTKSFASGSYETCDQVCLKNKHLSVAGSLFDSLNVDGFSLDAHDTTQLFFAQMNDVSSGINQLAVDNQVSIYPNPGSGIITVSSSKNIDEIMVTNLVGQPVLRDIETAVTKKNIDLSELPSGLYFITITSDNQTITNKVVVNR